MKIMYKKTCLARIHNNDTVRFQNGIQSMTEKDVNKRKQLIKWNKKTKDIRNSDNSNI